MTQNQFNAAFDRATFNPHEADCRRIQSIGLGALEIHMTTMQAQTIWKCHSKSYAASWLILNDYTDGDIASIITRFVEDDNTPFHQ